MIKMVRFFLLAFLSCILMVLGLAAQGAPPAGQTLFLQYKCNNCHAIQSLGIGQVKGEQEEEGEEEENEEKREPPDLSGAGLKRKAPWLQGFLLKKEKIDGRKHKKRFKGSKRELETISLWLETLTTEVKSKKKPEKSGN